MCTGAAVGRQVQRSLSKKQADGVRKQDLAGRVKYLLVITPTETLTYQQGQVENRIVLVYSFNTQLFDRRRKQESRDKQHQST